MGMNTVDELDDASGPPVLDVDRSKSKADLLAAEMQSRTADAGPEAEGGQDADAAVAQRQEEYKMLIDEMRTEDQRRTIATALDNEDVLSGQQVGGFRRKLASKAKQLGLLQEQPDA
jgi:hypothetical protein